VVWDSHNAHAPARRSHRAHPALAFPCSGLTCEATFATIPAAGSTIPANAPAVGVRATTFSASTADGGTDVRTSEVTSSSLKLSTGVTVLQVPTVVSDALLFFPDGGLVVGSSYNVAFSTGSCAGDGGFTVGAAAPLPTASAVLALSSLVIDQGNPGAVCGGNFGPTQASLLSVAATAEMLPWLALARWELEIDGQNWSTANYGYIKAAPQVGTYSGYRGAVDSFNVKCGTFAVAVPLRSRLAFTRRVCLRASPALRPRFPPTPLA